MTREDVILQIYRSLRDTFNPLDNVARDGNSVIVEHRGHQAKISFRIKISDIKQKKGQS